LERTGPYINGVTRQVIDYVKLFGTSASAFEAVAKSWKSLNVSSDLIFC
jgi:hypothetical protein